MRLLQLKDDGGFSVVECISAIPSYAILSHTWGPDVEEVTFRDLSHNSGSHKEGYKKLEFCGKQAARDGINHFWVDTACIDKSSSAELTEAINSMFKWYQNAEKCYVYMSDVSSLISGDDNAPDAGHDDLRRWKPKFEDSRWFTRGWTLQELIAPSSVEFYSREGHLLGDKLSLRQTLHEITGISLEALQGSPLHHFSVEERMSWAANRETKREEDSSYCLLGIFDIHLPLIYGEGKQKAFYRLQKEIQDGLNNTTVVLSQSTQNKSQQREEQLSTIYEWLAAPDPSLNYQTALKQRQDSTGVWLMNNERYNVWKKCAASSLWLHGIPGCGKTILSSIVLQDLLANYRDGQRNAVAYFYFDFNDPQKQLTDPMVRSLLCQLSQQSTKMPKHLFNVVSSYKYEQQQPPLDVLLEELRHVMEDFPKVYIMLDALDECAKRAELLNVLNIIAGWQLKTLHLLVTSRRELEIERTLAGFVDPENCISLQSHLVDTDIRRYVRQRLADDQSLSKWGKNHALRDEIEITLMKGSQGM